jgi:hypothetical protein
MPVRVRLTRKLSQMINGIDLSKSHLGQELELTPREAEILIAEGWADPVASADDKSPRRRRKKTRRDPL